jgi:hypothetical protein
MAHPVSDVGSNAEENIAHAAKIIGRSSHRRSVFDAIYTGKRRAKCVSQLIKSTGLPRTRVLDAGKRLADNHIVKAIRLEGETAYEKIGFFHSHKRRILGLAASPAKLKAFPTKRNPVSRAVHVKLSPRRAQITTITVDEIDSLRKVTPVDHRAPEIGDELSETEFKNGLQRIVGEDGRFRDWGGEVADLFTSRFRVGGRRRPVALAFKGPGTKGKLTPGKMGKNGDQIQRLFEAPAEVFLVQYCRQIDLTVPAQMRQLAIAKSLMTGARVFYGVIDGKDSRRIVRAYPSAFRRGRG